MYNLEFSYGRKAPESKIVSKRNENSKQIIKNYTKGPWHRARVYLVQSFNGFIEIKYLVRPIPSIYILQRFMRTKLSASFGDFGQFANDLKDLMNWQADVLSTVRAGLARIIKAIAVDNTRGDNNLHLTSVDDTPLKKKKAENRNHPSSKSPCPGGSPSELPPLI
ncbi:hypothetical protein C1645_879083 [Glomus cerebriforme]|uniref:Uncharacterized protein n=1 Tax=Glomus cerebriforme TaxID=658196 RepID=A0A397SJH9_9GLOM|nr:hypothetical protein C1645_879083 [Glomus cerebriforme]